MLRTSRSLVVHHRTFKLRLVESYSTVVFVRIRREISTSSSYGLSGCDTMALLVAGFHIRVNSASRGATMSKVL